MAALTETTLTTPLGRTLTLRTDGTTILLSRFGSNAPSPRAPRDPLLREASAQVRAYLRKRLRRFELPLHLAGTALQRAIWEYAAHLEWAEIVSYGDLARLVGAPRAHRAVAAAMAHAPLDLLIPAHRVVGADGTIHGASPSSMRRRLLAFEGVTLR